MKNCLARFLTPVLFLLSTSLFAQQLPEPIRFANGDFIPTNNIHQQAFKLADINSSLFAKKYFVVIQFSDLPNAQQQQALKQAGILLETYLPGKAWLASIDAGFNFSIARGLKISSINTVPPFYKIDRELTGFSPTKDKQAVKNIAVGYYQSIDKTTVITALQKAGARIVSTKYDASGIIFIQPDLAVVNAIAALPFVSSLKLQSIIDKPLNYNSIATHGVSGLNALNGKNLNGKGVTIGIGDNADISTHTDFTGRLINRSPWIPDDHGTHVAGSAAGGGIINVKNHGMASKAAIVNQYFSDIIVNAPAYVTDYNLAVTNNSYYSVDAGCVGNGKYDVLSNYVDNQMEDYSQLLHVVAAGNEGSSSCSPYLLGFATVKSGWQTAKNVLTVGAIKDDDYTIAYFSSRGPVNDGRLKPEITSSGWAVLSTNANDTYGYNFGTSMASPMVTGGVALMYEEYRRKNGGTNPKASLMKALACNTAEDLGNAGPDYTFGFGMLNVRRAVEAIDSSRFIINAVANGGNGNHVISVPPNTRRLKIMLYWADEAAAVNAATTLVNDLDLTVTEPSALLHRPLILNPSPSNVNDVAVEGVDHTNNIEQVVINNPTAGNYTIHVNGFAVPAGSQEYVVSYETDIASITVEYPFGGEKLVPGETENIRWTAYGNETNTFTVEYSANNGSSWTTINNNVAATARSIAWVVPAAVTNTALIKVSRNGTSLTDLSNFNFTILGRPVVTATNVCEGAVLLKWKKITNATSYDVVQLVADSMQVIGNTTDTIYLVIGLDKYKKAWFGAATKNGISSGRRSISVSAIPNSGPCTLADFNNDVKVDSILEPNSARQGFANAANATRPVKISIRNLGTTTANGPLNVSYSYAGNTVTEILNTNISAGATYTYTFTGMYTIPPAGFKYDFKAWVSLATDGNHLNDTAYKTVKYINNDAITSLPFTEGFETMLSDNFTKQEMAIGENKHFDFSTSSKKGRARIFVNTGFSYSGVRALTLDQTPYDTTATADSITVSYNLVNYNSKQLRLDFWYKNHGQANAPGNKVWIRGNENNAWIEAYDLYANQAALGEWAQAKININDLLGTAVPAQNITSTFQLKIGQEGYNSANAAHAVVDLDDGYTFDDLVLDEVSNDIALVKINSPALSDCALTATNPISIKVKNYNNATLSNIMVSYQLNGGAIVTETIPSIAPNQTIDYVFTQKANLSAYIDYTLNTWIKYPGDSYSKNDSILKFVVHNSPVITNYPYLQSFETDNGYFYTKGTNSSWEWGAPANIVINKAANGANAWVTNLTGNYKDNETSYLYSPCFNLSGLTQPMLSFSHVFEVELDYDYTWVEYSTDGVQWNKLGTSGSGTNWYNNATLNNWRISKTKWHVASFDLPTAAASIRFRFVMSSDAGVTEEGVGIDDIHVFDKAGIYSGATVTGISQNVTGSTWISFASAGKRIVSINANGMNLGNTIVSVYPFTGPVRTSNNTYYLDRNIVVKPANAPSGYVGVRFYFTEAEAQNLINANTCTFCAKPVDPYELGVTKYSSSHGDENGILADDTTGFFLYVLPDSTTIIPYDNGYYAEFNVRNFSEFWLSTNMIKPAVSGVCAGDVIVYTSAVTGTIYQWQIDNGSGYINLSDDAYYSGSNTATLEMLYIPSSNSGYKYRCVTDGVQGAANILRFSNSWMGTVDNDWFLSDNWSCGIVPDQFTDVIIPGGLINYPLINANAAVRKINIYPGATVTLMSGIKFDVKGK